MKKKENDSIFPFQILGNQSEDLDFYCIFYMELGFQQNWSEISIYIFLSLPCHLQLSKGYTYQNYSFMYITHPLSLLTLILLTFFLPYTKTILKWQNSLSSS